MKKKTVIIMAGCAALVAAAAAAIRLMAATGSTGSAAAGTSDGAAGSTGGTTAAGDAFPLRSGSRGANVSELQQRLNDRMAYRWPYLSEKPLHPYGANQGQPMTEIQVDGVFGQETLAFTRCLLGTDTVSRTQFDQLLIYP